jgi:type IV secretory pathway protease TraF
MHIRVTDLGDPFAELRRLDTRGRDAFAMKTCRIPSRHDVAIVNNDVHTSAPSDLFGCLFDHAHELSLQTPLLYQSPTVIY